MRISPFNAYALTLDRFWWTKDTRHWADDHEAHARHPEIKEKMRRRDSHVVVPECADNEVAKLATAKKFSRAAMIQDQVETIVAVADGCFTIQDVKNRIGEIFTDNQIGIVLSSVHRAKGDEADTVFILEPSLMPHPLAEQPWELIQERKVKKGNVLETARIAGIMAAKRTADIIPMCHPLNLTHVQVDFFIDSAESTIRIEARARLLGRTGVEMEALTAVSAAALTIYDMCKAIDRSMTITDIQLVEKSGGKSGRFVRSDLK